MSPSRLRKTGRSPARAWRNSDSSKTSRWLPSSPNPETCDRGSVSVGAVSLLAMPYLLGATLPGCRVCDPSVGLEGIPTGPRC